MRSFTREALVQAFALEGISGGNAVFNPEKLDWFNQQHIMRLAPDELAMRVKPWLERAGLWRDEYLGDRHAWFFAVLELLRPRAKRLGDFAAQGALFFSDAIEYDAAAVDKHLRAPGIDAHLEAVDAALAALETFDPASTEAALRAVAEARGVKAGVLIHAVRVARDGKNGKPWTVRRARTAGPGARARAAERGPPAAVDLAFLIVPFVFHHSTC